MTRWLDDNPDPTAQRIRQALDAAARRLPDDVTRRRLWATVAAPADGRQLRRWVPFLAGAGTAAALAAVLLVVLWTRSPTPPAKVVDLAPAGGPPAGAVVLPTIEPAPAVAIAVPPVARPLVTGPAVVATEANEERHVALRGGADADVLPGSDLVVDRRGVPAVRRGKVRFRVDHQAAGEHFQVDVGPYRVMVVGTRFQVAAGEDRLGVDVEEGVVEVWRGRRLARLEAGEAWSAPAAAARLGASGVGAAARGTPESAGRDPVETGSEEAEQTGTAAAARQITDPDALSEARAALAGGDVRRSLTLYEALARGKGPGAENAQYEVGRILRDRLADPRGAIAAWQRYRARYPQGLLRAEADLSIVETLASHGDSARAATEAAAFLRGHPDSERRAEMARLLGDLQRGAGDCRAAADSYAQALRSAPSAPVADHAAFHRAACLETLGDPRARGELEAYLRSHPTGKFRPQAERLRQDLAGGRE